MKTRFFLIVVLFLALAACNDNPLRPLCLPVLPVLPAQWEEILGEPHWRIEWVGEGGIWRTVEIDPLSPPPAISLSGEWTTALLAWPFWPEHDLVPGMMQPAGALFPWDASSGKVMLGWKGGVDAVFWKELAAAGRTDAASEIRLPWNFDWMRFRKLLEGNGGLAQELCDDPWLADWKELGRKTVQSGFDSRRIVSKPSVAIEIPGMGGHWMSSSPFAQPLDIPLDSPLVLMVNAVPDTWVSSRGILRCSSSGWVFMPSQ